MQNAGFLPRAVLEVGHKVLSGSLMAITTAGFATVGYGVYSLVFLRPKVQAGKKAAAAESTPSSDTNNMR
jgi:hypothetical protein